MWVNEAPPEQLATMIEYCAALKLVSGPNGEIFYANAAFREWSEYSLFELKSIGWKKLSVENDSLTADIEAAKQVGDGYIQSYTVRKQYRTKSGAAHWGNLSVIRYPASGEIQCYFCVWEPFKNGTSTAFAMAMEHAQKLDARIEAMTAELKMITTQTEEDRFFLSTIRMVQRYPKASAAMLFFALSIFGLNNIVELLQRTGLIQLPVKIERVGNEEQSHAVLAHEIADPVRIVAVASEFSQEIAGTKISLTKYSNGQFGPVSIGRGCLVSIDGRDCGSGDRFTSSSRTGRAKSDSITGMSRAEQF
jgi:PAS domain S-box-containing protein